MKRITVNFLFILFVVQNLLGQNLVSLTNFNACSIDGKPFETEIYSFSSSNEARDIVQNIMDKIGLKPNFKIKAANVPNASAVIEKGERYIYYNEGYIQGIKNTAKTNWAATFVLAHEIGHHLNGHTLDSIGSRPPKELEADEFAGFALFKIGATLEQALSAVMTFPEKACPTHPGRSARMQAVTVGWNKAKEENNSKNDSPTIPQTKKGNDSPEKENKNCETKNTGDYCFVNQTSQTIYVDLYDMDNEYNKFGSSIQVRTGDGPVLTIQPNSSECIYQYPAKVWQYTVKGTKALTYGLITIKSGNILIEKCQTKTITLNSDGSSTASKETNPTAKECETKSTGDYCFTNLTNEKLIVTIDENLNPQSLTLDPNESQCFYNLSATSHSYSAKPEWKGYHVNAVSQGQILITKCKSETRQIK
ncbi:MAG: M48 family metalloprotease [Bacteroidetes bacterium]|nr:M48 family metalloprotease [Bacteroidota bacterium]